MNPLNFRIGIGHDTHKLKLGGPLKLGGIEIPFDYSLDGHSDADVLLHAVTDALLGAAGLGDIGEIFPDTDPENYQRDSANMLKQAWILVQQSQFKIINIDCIVFAQRPKLSAYKAAIANRIANLLDTHPNRVGIKAKTGENVGLIGEMKIMQAQCIALLYQADT